MIKKGFTLAEVLITLGIIGVVSALTIPQLSSRTANAHLGAEYAKAISTLENGIGMFFYENNVKNAKQLSDDDYSTLTISQLLGALESENYIKMKSGADTTSNICEGGYTLADKSVICASANCDLKATPIHKGSVDCELIFLSSKSTKLTSPIEGLDYFKMSLSPDGLIYIPGADYNSADTTCTKTGGGGACAGKVAKNGWKFSDAMFEN